MNGELFAWIESYVGPNIAAILVLSMAALYVFSYVSRRKPNIGELDITVAEAQNKTHKFETPLKHLQGEKHD